jgi:hypothetical protein
MSMDKADGDTTANDQLQNTQPGTNGPDLRKQKILSLLQYLQFLVTTPPKTLNLADPRARHVLPPKKRFRIDNPTDTDKNPSKGSQTTTMPEDTSDGPNAREERSIDNPRPEQLQPTYIRKDNRAEVTHQDPQFLDHILSKAMSASASKLTREEAKILVENKLALPPRNANRNTTHKYKCHFCEIMGRTVASFRRPCQIAKHYREHMKYGQIRRCIRSKLINDENKSAETESNQVEPGADHNPSE